MTFFLFFFLTTGGQESHRLLLGFLQHWGVGFSNLVFCAEFFQHRFRQCAYACAWTTENGSENVCDRCHTGNFVVVCEWRSLRRILQMRSSQLSIKKKPQYLLPASNDQMFEILDGFFSKVFFFFVQFYCYKFKAF